MMTSGHQSQNTIFVILPILILILSCTPVHEEQQLLAVVEKGVSSLGFYSLNGERVAGIKLDTFPHEMRLSPDRKFAYITNNGSLRYRDTVEGENTVSVVNLQTLEKEEDIVLDPYRRPHGIDIDPETGLLAVSVENPDQLLLVDPVSRTIIGNFDCFGKTPHMVTISRGARFIYASNVISSNVVQVNIETGEHFSVDVGEGPQESVLSSDGSILFVGCIDYTSVIDLKKQSEIAHIPYGCNRLDLIHNGTLLIMSGTKNGIGFADALDFNMIHNIDIPYQPFSIHVSEDEQFAYVAAEEQNVIYIVNIAARKIVRKFKTGDHVRPDPVMDFRIPKRFDFAGQRETLQKIQFDRTELDTAFPQAYQIKSADLNGDALPDLIAVSNQLNEVAWYENPTWERHLLTDKTRRNIDLAPYDVDRDGDVDVVLASRFSQSDTEQGGYIHWFENPGLGVSEEWDFHFIDSLPSTHRIRWADVNGDGIKELINLPLLGIGATAPEYGVPLKLISYKIPENPASDPWSKWVIDSSLHLAHGLSITRWDNDLKEDILTASFEGISMFRSAGELNAFSWEQIHLAAGKVGAKPETGSSEISVGQYGDYQTFYLASIEPWHGNEVVVYTLDTNSLWTRRVIDSTFNDGHALICYDLDYNGFDEIIAGHRGEGFNLYVYQYQPATDTWSRVDVDTGEISAAGLCILDADRDGWPDIAACGSRTNNVVLYYNKTGY